MIRLFKDLEDRATTVGDIFRMYSESYRQFLEIAEQCAIKRSPNHKLMLQVTFGLQDVLNKRQALRFEYLLRGNTFVSEVWKSLSRISERLEKEWGEEEEAALKKNKAYADVLREIEALQVKLDPAAITEPLHALERDSNYRDARLALADRVREFEKRLRT
jgi:hypothetical protein